MTAAANTQETPWRINNSGYGASEKCACGHTFAAHGSSGLICCACDCKIFCPLVKVSVDICKAEIYSGNSMTRPASQFENIKSTAITAQPTGGHVARDDP